MGKKLLSLFLALVIMLSLAACAAKPAPTVAPTATSGAGTNQASGKTVKFKDSSGRELEVPAEIKRIAVTGPSAQTVVFALAPEMLVGVATSFADSAPQFLNEKYLKLPVLGQLYGGKGQINLEQLLTAAPQIVIDVGETTSSIAADMDALSKQTGIPFVHISASISKMSETYRMLGELLGLKSEAKVLGDYCDEIYKKTTDIANKAQKGGRSLLPWG